MKKEKKTTNVFDVSDLNNREIKLLKRIVKEWSKEKIREIKDSAFILNNHLSKLEGSKNEKN